MAERQDVGGSVVEEGWRGYGMPVCRGELRETDRSREQGKGQAKYRQ